MKGLLLSKAFSEINRAKRSRIALRAARSFPASEEAWCDGIASIERAWEKAYAEFRNVGGFVDWNAEFVALRRSDPLLQYVHQARNAADHTIEDSVHLNGGYTALNPVEKGGRMCIKELTIKNGRIERLDTGGTPIRIETRGPHPELKAFVCRGVNFVPPGKHLETPIDGRDPVEVLGRAIEFYEAYLQKLRDRFHKTA